MKSVKRSWNSAWWSQMRSNQVSLKLTRSETNFIIETWLEVSRDVIAKMQKCSQSFNESFRMQSWSLREYGLKKMEWRDLDFFLNAVTADFISLKFIFNEHKSKLVIIYFWNKNRFLTDFAFKTTLNRFGNVPDSDSNLKPILVEI